MHDIYDESVEKLVEEEVPNVNVLASGTSSHGMNSYQAFDQPQDGELSDQNGLYLTHQKGKQQYSYYIYICFSLRAQRINFPFGAILIDDVRLCQCVLCHTKMQHVYLYLSRS